MFNKKVSASLLSATKCYNNFIPRDEVVVALVALLIFRTAAKKLVKVDFHEAKCINARGVLFVLILLQKNHFIVKYKQFLRFSGETFRCKHSTNQNAIFRVHYYAKNTQYLVEVKVTDLFLIP